MSIQLEQARVGRQFDRRAHITQAERSLIKRLHQSGESTRAIARALAGRVSRRMIGFIINPASYEAFKKKNKKKKQHRQRYDRAEHSAAMQRHRAHKQSLLTQNLI